MSNVTELRKCRIVALPKGKQEVHETYGLWVCKTLSKFVFQPRNKIHPRYFEFYSISHLIEGKGWFWSEKMGETKYLEAGQGIISTPGFVQFYSGNKNVYVEDSICFAGPIANNLFRTGIIQNGILNIGMGRRLLPIIELAGDPSRDSQIKANIALHNLLIDLYFENKKNKSMSSAMETLLEKIINSPEKWWTVHEMADLCNLSINHFRRLFCAHTGLNPKEYIDKLKINKAIELLCDGNNSIAKVSDCLGYNDQYHFSRRFKETTGSSPAQYRKEIIQSSGHRPSN